MSKSAGLEQHSTGRVYTSETSSEKFMDMKKIALKHNASKRKIKGGLNPMINRILWPVMN
ncbi:hypothetical protein D9F03_23140 [Escherichia coli]|nr:hypothetical protein [Escherichia coli]